MPLYSWRSVKSVSLISFETLKRQRKREKERKRDREKESKREREKERKIVRGKERKRER